MSRTRVRAGAYRHRVTIEKPTRTDDVYGGADVTWSTHVRAWALVRPLSTRETFFAHQIQSETTHRIELRYQEGVLPDMRVVFGSRTFLILGVRDVEERRRKLELDCKEIPVQTAP